MGFLLSGRAVATTTLSPRYRHLAAVGKHKAGLGICQGRLEQCQRNMNMSYLFNIGLNLTTDEPAICAT
jgi:hypothetical protein